MPPRYIDEPDYSREPRTSAAARERDPRRDNRDPRDTRRPIDPQARRDVPRDPRMEQPMDQTMDLGSRNMPGDPRANTAATRIERAPRGIGARPDEMIYEDSQTGQLYRGDRRTPYQDEFNEMPPSARPIIDPGRDRTQPRPTYNEYFLPGDGIDREVIQSEICRYLGQDATCRPGPSNDGRRGYIVRAYRALTTEMIRSLKEDSAKYSTEKERAARRNQRAVPYAQMRDATRYEDEMMIDDEPPRQYMSHTRLPEPDLRTAVRPGQLPITAPYMESGFPAPQYPLGPGPPATGLSFEPRYAPASGNTPPHPGRPSQPGYSPSEYAPGTTRPPTQPLPAGSYRDPRTGNIMSGYPYPTDNSAQRRHR